VNTEPTTLPTDACWFPVPTPGERDALDMWASDVARHWAAALDVDEAGTQAVCRAVRELGLTYFDPAAPVRAFWFMPGTTGAMFDFSARSAATGVPWSDGQRLLLQEYCKDAVATEWLTSDTPGLSATIALSTYDDHENVADAFGNTTGFAQIVAVVRRETPHGEIDVVGRAIDGDVGLIEMSAYAVLSLLYGDDDLLATVRRNLHSHPTPEENNHGQSERLL
jgi:hypothetical protein